MSTKGDKEITDIKSQGNSSFHLFFVEKRRCHSGHPYDLQSHMDDRLHRGWGREQKGWQNGKKNKQKKAQKKRERHTYTHTRSYNDNCNDNIVTTIIIFIPLLPFLLFSLSFFPFLPSFFLSFTFNFLRTHTHSHEKISPFFSLSFSSLLFTLVAHNFN